MEGLTIGKLAKEAGVGVETIRFYERKGLIQQPKKNSGFRKYPISDAVRIRFIKRAQELGFTLIEIDALLRLKARTKSKCGDVKKKAEQKLTEIEKKLSDMKKMQRSLKKLIGDCDCVEADISECPIIDCFEKGAVK